MSSRHISRRLDDGSTITASPQIVEQAMLAQEDYYQRRRDWVETMRAQGAKASHPYDGWISRSTKTLHLAYPDFNDGAGLGDLIALGGPDEHRLVRITEVFPSRVAQGVYPGWESWYLRYEEVSP